MTKDFFDMIWKLLILVFLLLILVAIKSAHAESVVVSFNDAEQLAAISDSIVGMCDTVKGYRVYEDTVYNYKIYVAEIGKDIELDYAYVDTDSTDEYPYWVDGSITCRELVSRTVVELPFIRHDWSSSSDTLIVPVTVPGTAIITWRKQ